MKLPGKGFWLGLVLGTVIGGGAGLFYMNQHMRVMHTLLGLSAAPRVTHLNGLRARLEAGELEWADQYHRVMAWSYRQEGQLSQCMADSRWVLSTTAQERCLEHFHTEIPEDWEIPMLDKARADIARRIEARNTASDADS